MTKLYFHAIASTVGGTLPTTEQSALTSTVNGDAQTVNRSMDTSIGTTQSTITFTTGASASLQDCYTTKFVSNPLTGITSITAQTWNYAFAAAEANANANFPVSLTSQVVYINAYVWTPSNGTKRGTILDGNTAANYSEPGTTATETSEFGTFAGSLVSSVADGDVIVAEIWFRITQANATARTNTFYLDGTTETNSTGTTVSNHASYVETPQSLTFQSRVKLYFHDLVNNETTLPSTEQSTLTADGSVDTLNRYMNTTIGTAQTSQALISNGTVSQQNYYITRFVSDKLNGISTITADTWEYAFAAQESNAGANFPAGAANTAVYINCYVWRPASGGSLIGTILDGNSAAVYAEAGSANTERAMYGTFSGAQVTGISNGDVIVLEVWFRITQANTTVYTDTFFYDGTTENKTLNATVSNHASFISTFNQLAFTAATTRKAIIKALTETIAISESVTGLVVPAPGPNSAILTKKGTITFDATSGIHDQAFTGIGFQPKALIIFGVATTGSSFADGVSVTYGMSDGTTSGSIGCAVKDGAGLTNASIRRNDSIISILDPITTVTTELVRGALKTFDTDGFTITWNVKNTTQYILHYMAIAGSDITNVKVKHETAGTTSAGNKAYTGTGFQPDAIITASTISGTVNTAISNSAQLCIGACAGGVSTGSWCNAWAQGNANPNDKYVWSPGFLYQRDTNFTNLARAQPVSFDSDGYTVNYTTAPSVSTLAWFYLAIKGGYWKTGTFAQRNGTGTQTVSMPPIGVDPELILFAGDNATSLNTQDQSAGSYVGAADNTAEGVAAFGSSSATATSMVSLATKAIKCITPNATAASSTTQAEADVSDMATLGQFTLNWSTADSNGRYSGFLCLEKNAASTGANIAKALTETISITDALARLNAKIRTGTETITISSPVARLSAKNRPLATETITISSPVARIKGAVKALTETITISSPVSRLAVKIRSLTETISILSTVARIKSTAKSISQTITISDSLAPLLRKKIRTLTETITISSPVTRLSAKARSLAAETVTIASTVTKSKGALKSLSETVTTSSTIARLVAKIRTLIETITISSTPTRLAAKIRSLTQTITITDAVARVLGARAISKTLTETITIATASLNRLAAKTRTATETITIASSPAKLSAKIRSLAVETITTSATVTRIKGAVKALTETITISSTVTRLTAKIRQITTTITVADSVTRAKAGAVNIFKSLTETITISSTVTKTQSKIRLLAETISLTPSTVARLASKTRAVTPESVTIGAGLATRLRGLVRTSTNSISAISTLTRLAKKIRTLTETITIQDQLSSVSPHVQPKPPPRPSISILAQELRYITTVRKDLQRFLFETVHVSDLARLEVKRYSKIIRTARVKKIVRILDLVKLADDIYNNKRR